MERHAAERFLDALALLELPIGRMDAVLKEFNGTEKEEYKEKVGNLLRAHFELLVSLTKQFPELDPDGEGREAYEKLRAKHAQNLP